MIKKCVSAAWTRRRMVWKTKAILLGKAFRRPGGQQQRNGPRWSPGVRRIPWRTRNVWSSTCSRTLLGNFYCSLVLFWIGLGYAVFSFNFNIFNEFWNTKLRSFGSPEPPICQLHFFKRQLHLGQVPPVQVPLVSTSLLEA